MAKTKIDNKQLIMAYIRRKQRTANELAEALELSVSAVRVHLLSLENDGLIIRDSKRITGAGQPTIVFKLASDKEDAFSHAYKPMLVQLLDLLPEKLDEQELVQLMERVGEQLALKQPDVAGSLKSKVEKAKNILTDLGAIIELQDMQDGILLTNYSCPLADAVRCRPEVCQAVTGFLHTITSAKIEEQCQRDKSPLICEFKIYNELN